MVYRRALGISTWNTFFHFVRIVKSWDGGEMWNKLNLKINLFPSLLCHLGNFFSDSITIIINSCTRTWWNHKSNIALQLHTFFDDLNICLRALEFRWMIKTVNLAVCVKCAWSRTSCAKPTVLMPCFLPINSDARIAKCKCCAVSCTESSIFHPPTGICLFKSPNKTISMSAFLNSNRDKTLLELISCNGQGVRINLNNIGREYFYEFSIK